MYERGGLKMAHPYARTRRVADMIKRELAQMLLQEAQDPRFTLVTITGVELSRDYSRAKIFIALQEHEQGHDTLVALNKAAGFFRYRLAQSVKLRSVPQMRFVYDDAFRNGQRISDLINNEFKDNQFAEEVQYNDNKEFDYNSEY